MSRIPLRFIPPQLATSVDQPPEGSDWIHEIKHDGYRCQVLLERGQVRVFTRNGHDWTDRYPSIVLAAANLRCKSAIIDGEAISFWSPFSNAIRDGAGESSVPSPFRTALDDFLRHCRVEATERCE